jgi:hypothetical protein
MSAPQQSGPVPTIDVDDARVEAAAAPASTYVTASQDALFAADASDRESRCDVCGEPIPEEATEGYAVNGRGLYVWSRRRSSQANGDDDLGHEVRYEEPPLCPACAVAVGVSAMARWEIEEEEG